MAYFLFFILQKILQPLIYSNKKQECNEFEKLKNFKTNIASNILQRSKGPKIKTNIASNILQMKIIYCKTYSMFQSL